MLSSLLTTLKHWTGGVRFYIGCAAILITFEAWWWASVSYPGSTLFATRLEEVYAWLAVALMGAALLIGPLCAIFRKLPGRAILYDARRLVGMSAAWFALLHVTIVYSSLFKWVNPLHLPSSYQESFLYGFGALLILLLMAATSFDRAQAAMGVWWFRLHRLVYVAGLLTLLHAFLTGAHSKERWILNMLSIFTFWIVVLHAYLMYKRPGKPTVWQVVTLSSMSILLIAVFSYAWSLPAQAHVLKQDNGTAAVLHIPPEDSPQAGQQVELLLTFYSEQAAFTVKNCDCRVQVTSGNQTVLRNVLQPKGKTKNEAVTAVQFPRAGVYDVIISGTARDAHFASFKLDYLVRVSPPPGSASATVAGEGVMIIGIGSVIIISMVGYTLVSRGGRYRKQPANKRGK